MNLDLEKLNDFTIEELSAVIRTARKKANKTTQIGMEWLFMEDKARNVLEEKIIDRLKAE